MASFETPWPPLGLDEWLAQVEAGPQNRWIIDKLLPADGVTLVSGPAKLGHKTLAAMKVARCVATGRSDVGLSLAPEFDGVPHKVLFMEYEGPRIALASEWRWLDTGAGWPATLSNIRWMHRYGHVRLTDYDWLQRLCDYVQANAVKLVVVDTMIRAAGAPENDSQAMDGIAAGFDKLRAATDGGAVLYIHHLRKAGGADEWEEDIDTSLRGSTAIAGSYDHHLAFRTGHAPGSLHLYTRSKLDEDRVYRVRWNVDAEQRRANWTVEAFGRMPDDALLHVCASMIDSQQVHTLRQLAELWDLPRPVAEQTVAALVAIGVLTRSARGFARAK